MDGCEVHHRLLPCQQLSAELDIQQDVLETLLSYLEAGPPLLPCHALLGVTRLHRLALELCLRAAHACMRVLHGDSSDQRACRTTPAST